MYSQLYFQYQLLMIDTSEYIVKRHETRETFLIPKLKSDLRSSLENSSNSSNRKHYHSI